ncbi:hypothetical protein [Deinococcus altitudinis]|uniref:hypothetical protein n=1 Tax=Deinococcus altitudinis TaxID=468914 RepID=UPI003891C17D
MLLVDTLDPSLLEHIHLGGGVLVLLLADAWPMRLMICWLRQGDTFMQSMQ